MEPDYTRIALAMARKYIEALPKGYEPGQRSGPQEREVHACIVVAERLREGAKE